MITSQQNPKSLLVDGVGFEPTEPIQVQQFSRLSRSTTPAPIHISKSISYGDNDNKITKIYTVKNFSKN